MFGRRGVFGKKRETLGEPKDTSRPAPDADRTAPAFHKMQWDHPQIGSLLRDAGFVPDNEHDAAPTADNSLAVFAAASRRLQQRTEAFNRDMAAQYGYCHALPFLIIDQKIWDGPHGAFLYGQMDLIGYDEWNVIMLAGDPQTTASCGLAAHPGFLPAVTQTMTEHVIEWKARHSGLLETFRNAGGGDIPREQHEIDKDALRREIIDKAGWMKPRIIDELQRRG